SPSTVRPPASHQTGVSNSSPLMLMRLAIRRGGRGSRAFRGAEGGFSLRSRILLYRSFSFKRSSLGRSQYVSERRASKRTRASALPLAHLSQTLSPDGTCEIVQ